MARILPFRLPVGRKRGRLGGSDARAEGPPPSDARRADDLPRGGEPDPEIERRRRFRKAALLLVMVLVFLGGAAAALVGNHGYLDVRRSRVELVALAKEVDVLQAEASDLKRQVDRLKSDPFAIERIAREELGYGQEGEVTILLPREEDRVPGSTLKLPDPPLPKVAPGSTGQQVPRD